MSDLENDKFAHNQIRHRHSCLFASSFKELANKTLWLLLDSQILSENLLIIFLKAWIKMPNAPSVNYY